MDCPVRTSMRLPYLRSFASILLASLAVVGCGSAGPTDHDAIVVVGGASSSAGHRDMPQQAVNTSTAADGVVNGRATPKLDGSAIPVNAPGLDRTRGSFGRAPLAMH